MRSRLSGLQPMFQLSPRRTIEVRASYHGALLLSRSDVYRGDWVGVSPRGGMGGQRHRDKTSTVLRTILLTQWPTCPLDGSKVTHPIRSECT